MVTMRNPFRRQDSVDATTTTAAPELAHHASAEDIKSPQDEKKDAFDADAGVSAEPHEVHAHNPWAEAGEENMLANGKERPIETAEDIATRCISLEDDPLMPVHTFRMYFLGLGLTCFAAVLGQIFYFRPQTVYVSQLFLQVIAFILGRAWSAVLPNASRGKVWAFLNPCEFTLKEHVAILIMSSTATSSAEAISVFAADDLYYNITPNYGVAIFTLLASQLLGYGLAGLMRSFAVFPTYIVYPNLIPTVNLFDALHRDKDVGAQRKRLRLFWIVFIAILCWEFVPEFIAPTLTGISIVCLARRNSPWVTRIFGGSNGNEGLGLFSICLDWNYVGSGGGSLGALFTPITTQISQYLGILLCIIIFCAMYAANTWNAAHFPFLSQQLFYENGTIYDQLSILNSDYSLNKTALDEQGLPWYAASNAIYYLGCNLAIGATLTHVGLWYWRPILNAIRQFKTRQIDDPHYQKMRVYKEVPMWVYGGIIVGSFAMAMATCYTGHSQLPWWALIVAIILAAFMFPFVCVIYAITGFKTDVQQLAQMLGAAVVPGNSQANMYFTLYGYNSCAQGLSLARDLKLSQYTKLSPIACLTVQVLGTVVGAILQLIIMKQVVSNQREILLDTQGSNVWSGQQVQSFNSQAVSWGALAKYFYGPGSPYQIIPYCILIGLAVPVPFYVAHKFFPKLRLNTFVSPITLWCLGNLSVGINSSIFMTVCLGFFSQFYLRRYCATWFRKYNYLVSAGLDGGTQLFVFIATFALFGAAGSAQTMPNWALNPTGNYDYCMRLTPAN
ncbi:hypothetical protein JCM8115_002013 [Rhodotorula mucilaginosa]|uniref:Peptide transporter MTD1 n=1 Tax=Rhodotorula mucilaginosa TaxID=5537 RepID=A0A9P6VYE5_RHOMI|nr:hypothetical protein C6P46_005756 [Rhodotorula mucilaginosa]